MSNIDKTLPYGVSLSKAQKLTLEHKVLSAAAEASKARRSN